MHLDIEPQNMFGLFCSREVSFKRILLLEESPLGGLSFGVPRKFAGELVGDCGSKLTQRQRERGQKRALRDSLECFQKLGTPFWFGVG